MHMIAKEMRRRCHVAGVGVKGGCEHPNLGTRSQAGPLQEQIVHAFHCVISPALTMLSVAVIVLKIGI